MRVRNLDTESNALTADVAFCHWAAPPYESVVSAMDTAVRLYQTSLQHINSIITRIKMQAIFTKLSILHKYIYLPAIKTDEITPPTQILLQCKPIFIKLPTIRTVNLHMKP